MKKLLIILTAVFLILTACTNDKPQEINDPKGADLTETVTVYFGDENATGLVAETREVSEKTPENAIIELLKGSNRNVTMIAEGTSLLGITVDGAEATADFSKEFLASTGDTMAIYSVVNTLTQFDNIHFVKITVEGEENAFLGNYILSEAFTENSSLIIK